jgi:hypothetical protein
MESDANASSVVDGSDQLTQGQRDAFDELERLAAGEPIEQQPAWTRKRMTRSAVTNGKRLHVEPIHENAWSRRFRDILGEIISDLGGPDNLTEGQRQLARRAATISIECERLEVRAVSGKSLLETAGAGPDGMTPLQILHEAGRVLHGLARHGMGGHYVSDLAAKPRYEQDRVINLLVQAADIAAKAHVAGSPIDVEIYGMLCDRLNRIFVRLGLERVPRDITSLPEYLEAAAQQAPQEHAENDRTSFRNDVSTPRATEPLPQEE